MRLRCPLDPLRWPFREQLRLLSHGRPISSQKGPKSAIATWYLRLRVIEVGVRFSFRIAGRKGKGPSLSGGSVVRGWLFFNGRCGVVLDPRMANMWRRGGEKRHDAPDDCSLAVVIPCAARGFRGRVLSLVSVYGPVSGAGFDQERRVMFDCLSTLLGFLPFRSVWIVGGDFNAEVGCRGVGEESSWVVMHMDVGLGLGIRCLNGLRVKIWAFFCLLHDKFAGILGTTPKVGLDIQSTIIV